MAVPRPLLLALIGAVLLAATFMATRSSTDNSSDSSAPATRAPSPATQAKATAPALKPQGKIGVQPKSSSPAKSSSAAKPRAKQAAKPAQSASKGRLAAVERAVGRRRIVVLAFFQPGADDRATRSAVAALERRHSAAVFVERIGNIGRYRPIVGNLGVNQAPAVVIVDRKRRARVIEGYVDAETLAQEVADARG